MKNLLSKIKTCDGEFCENVGISALAVTAFSIMFLSIAQMSA